MTQTFVYTLNNKEVLFH